MTKLQIAFTVVHVVLSVILVLVVLFQSGKSAGLSGAIAGAADSFMSKGNAQTFDAKLARATKWMGAAFLILTIVLLILG